MRIKETLILGAVFALAAALRIYRLEHLSLWLDERTSLDVAGNSLGAIIAGKGFDRHTPPLYYMLLHLWLLVFPASEWGLRSFSVVCDLVSLVFLLAAFSRQFGKTTGLAAAILYAVSPFAVYYSQEGRMYALMMALAAAVYYLTLRYLDGQLRLRGKIALVALAVCGSYTHYYFILYLLALTAAVIAVCRRDRQRALVWLCLMGVAAICFIPWLGVVYGLAESGGQPFRRFVFLVLPYTFFRFSAGYAILPLNYDTKDNIAAAITGAWPAAAVYVLVFSAAALSGVAVLWRGWGSRSVLILSPLLLPAALALLISLRAPMLSERYLSVSYPFFIGLLALAVSSAGSKRRRLLFFVSLVALSLAGLERYYFSSDFGKTQWRQASAYIAAAAAETRTVYINPPFAKGLLTFYLPQSFAVVALSGDNAPSVIRSAAPPELWLVERGTADTVKHYFVDQGYQLVRERLFPLENGIRLFYFRQTNKAALSQPMIEP